MMLNETDIEPQVTINITAHAEGYFLHKSIKSAELCCKYALDEGNIHTIIHLHLDNPDDLTRKIAQAAVENNDNIKLFINSFRDLSASRNFLIDQTRTKYTLFLDGDDLFSENMILESYKTAEEYGKPCIVSVDNIFKFNENIYPIVHKPQSTIDYPQIKSALFETNLFVSQNFVSTDIYKECLYEPNTICYGFEDWHWNTKAISAGFEFLIAPNTAFFYRQKAEDKSLLRMHTTSNTVVRPSPLFKSSIYKKMPYVRYYPAADAVYQNYIRKIGREELSRIISPNSMLFKIVRKFYHLTQMSFAPILHFLRNGNTQQIVPTNGMSSFNFEENSIEIWNRLNSIEPIICLTKDVVDGLTAYSYTFEHSLVTAYHDLCDEFGEKGITDIIFVPWLSLGGADLAIVDMVKELAEQGRRPLIITTSGIDSKLKGTIEKIDGVSFIQSHDETLRYLDHHGLKLVLLRLIQNWGIRSVTVMNSAIGFELLSRFGRVIKDSGCMVVVHNYAFPRIEDLLVEAFPSFANSLEFIDKIVVDSERHKQDVEKIYGICDNRIVVVPLIMTTGLHEKVSKPTHRVLYANRLAREKQPDVAIKTFTLPQTEEYDLDMYGVADVEYCKKIGFAELLQSAPRVDFKGSFDGTKNLNFDDYDICFLPSLYEGTPRIVLDSIKANLFIICTDVGGLSEVVIDGKNGFLLPPESTSEDFAQAIVRYYDDPKLQDLRLRKHITGEIVKLHSVTRYKTGIKNVYSDKKGSQNG